MAWKPCHRWPMDRESCGSIRASMNRSKCSLGCKTSVLESSQRTSKRSLIPSTPPNRREWEWGWQSVARLLRIMAGSYGPRPMTVQEQHFNLLYEVPVGVPQPPVTDECCHKSDGCLLVFRLGR